MLGFNPAFTMPVLGFYPYSGVLFPKGTHNIIPESLRKYPIYYRKTITLFPEWLDMTTMSTVYPLGMKAFPDKFLNPIQNQLYKAITNSDFKSIERILDKNKDFDVNNEIILPEYKLTALGVASSLNLFEIVHYLSLRGVDYETPIGPFKKTALHLAVENNAEFTAKFLLNNGANMDAKDIFGFTIYDKAEFRGLLHYKSTFDHFKKYPKTRNYINYEEYRFTQPVKLENIDTISFRPSSIIETAPLHKLVPLFPDEKIALDKFGLYLYSIYGNRNFEKQEKLSKIRRRYSNLYHYENL
jgi:hypothetical protein